MSESKSVARRTQTSDLTVKKTSPTLAEFKTKNAVVPDWRIQLQNTVRQRSGRLEANPVSTNAVASAAPASRGAAALKVQYAPQAETENAVDLKVANALKRIEQSRRTYLPSERAREGIRVAKAASKKFPFNVVSRSADAPELPIALEKEPTEVIRPRLISSMKIEKREYDTNKLIPIPEAARMETSFETEERPEDARPMLRENWSQKIEIKGSDIENAEVEPDEEIEISEAEEINDAELELEETDDLAPLAMRFNAGLFDLIIGGFASFVLFSPFLGFYDGWASVAGFLLFTTILLAVMFVYLTGSIAFLGQTFGMKLFSLELVDAEQSDFPTLHQAAVNSSVYLLSLVVGGLGFLPLFFNEEKRAAHDLVSGLILVREA